MQNMTLSHVPEFRSLQLCLWIKAFITTIHLMNYPPSSALNLKTPYFALHGSHPDYSSLRAFRSKCFPYMWGTSKHKFDLKTIPCIFVGCSETYQAYKCMTKSLRSHTKIFQNELCSLYK